jgi:hypothetical protein
MGLNKFVHELFLFNDKLKRKNFSMHWWELWSCNWRPMVWGLSHGINLLQIQDKATYKRPIMDLTLSWTSLGAALCFFFRICSKTYMDLMSGIVRNRMKEKYLCRLPRFNIEHLNTGSNFIKRGSVPSLCM